MQHSNQPTAIGLENYGQLYAYLLRYGAAREGSGTPILRGLPRVQFQDSPDEPAR